MQPVKTTPRRASEAVRSLNAVNNREAGGMVMFRTGIGLKEGLVAEEVAATHALHREFSKQTTGRWFLIVHYNSATAISGSRVIDISQIALPARVQEWP